MALFISWQEAENLTDLMKWTMSSEMVLRCPESQQSERTPEVDGICEGCSPMHEAIKLEMKQHGGQVDASD